MQRAGQRMLPAFLRWRRTWAFRARMACVEMLTPLKPNVSNITSNIFSRFCFGFSAASVSTTSRQSDRYMQFAAIRLSFNENRKSAEQEISTCTKLESATSDCPARLQLANLKSTHLTEFGTSINSTAHV